MSDGPDDLFAAKARIDLLTIATGYVGCSAADDDRARYEDLIAHGETVERAAELDKASSCGLAIRGFWREYGVRDPRVDATYHNGRVIADLVAMAREAGAWRTGHIDELGAGDLVLLGGEEHVLTVTEIGMGFVRSVDGGQRISGIEAILARTRKLLVGPVGARLVGDEGARPIMGWASWPLVAWRFLNRPENA